MFKLKWGILILFVSILVAEFHVGDTLKCIVCKSTDDENCIDAPTKVETSECDSTTTVPPTTTPTTTVPSTTTPTTAAPSTTTPTTAEPSTTTPTTAEPSTTTPTTAAPSTTTPTTAAPSTTTPTTAASSTTTTSTAAPSTTTPTTEVSPEATSPTTVTPTTTPSTATSSTTTTSTTAPSTTTPTPEVSSETASTTGTSPADDTTGSNDANPDTQNNQKIPQAIQINRRSRRQAEASVFAESNFQCYKMVYQAGGTEVVERGCTQTTCDALKAGKEDVSFCGVCNEDGCNSSSMIITNITLILSLLGITFYLTR